MHISIDVSGTVYDVPLDGSIVEGSVDGRDAEMFGQVPISIRVVSGLNRVPLPAIHAERKERVHSFIPSAPEWTTVADLLDAAADIPRTTMGRLLRELAADGAIRSTRPRSTRRGQNARRWTRT
jgi:hypothetical protein